MSVAETFKSELNTLGISVEIDAKSGSLGRRLTDWELKGVPVRLEIGPRDLAEGVVSVARRDTGEKTNVALAEVAAHVASLLETMHSDLLALSLQRRDDQTVTVNSLDEAKDAARVGFAKMEWSAVGDEGEAALNRETLSVRCLQRPDGSLPESPEEADLVCIIARSY